MRSEILETVVGSPSKPPQAVHRQESSVYLDLNEYETVPEEQETRVNIRAESVSAPNSSFRSALHAGSGFSDNDVSAATSGEGSKQTQKRKERRRQSWNDFVIPTKVLERQRGLKQEIGAVKKFAGGLEST